ncbi:MAG: Cobalt-zinc-cadmium resistance protein CzcA [Myxococcaceae bacterium]|nr:Cobalt-zinc-cadmium resistance protein CzcA [Myxococcaceae bacterium]
MIGKIVAWSLAHRFLVLLAVLGLVGLGVRAYLGLPIDAVPDTTNVQVQVLTNAPGLSPLEVEQLVTRPVELAMSGLPGAQLVRSMSRSAVSAVTIIFHDDVELAYARALVSQRLPAARESIPASAKRPELGPMSTGLGEVYHFTMAWPGHSLRDTRTLLDWDVAYALRSVPGVVEVNGWGGLSRQVEVRLRPADLQALGVTQHDVEACLLGGGQNGGGGALERSQEQVLVRLDGQYRTVEQVAGQIVRTRPGGVPILVRDVATVREGEAFRSSASTADGEGETVYAMVQMIAGGNANQVVPRVVERLEAIQKRLPAGVKIEPFYVRTALVNRVLDTVKRSLLEGGLIVVVVLFLFLGHARAAIVVATAIPLSLLGAFACMSAFGMSGNLMSLGAVDFGLVVDGAVVVIEGALATMVMHKMHASDALEHEGHALGGPIAFGVLIIGLVYVPILLLEGVEGKMFRPMAWTVLFALGTALVLSFTWIPVLASVLIKDVHEGDSRVVRILRRGYEPILGVVMKRKVIAPILALVLIGVGAVAAMGRGAEFVPRLEEGDLVIQLTRPPSVSLTEAIQGTTTVEATLRKFPEVRRVVSRTGSPDVATDIMGIEQSDIFVLLAPRAEWKTAASREELVAIFEKELRRALPGALFSFTQPIEMRAQELLGGLKTDVGVKVFGDDLPTLTRIVEQVQQILASTPGAADVRAEPTTGLVIATIRPNVAAMGRLGVRAEDVRVAIESLRAGRTVGVLVEGERRFDIAVRLDVPPTPDVATLRRLPLLLPDGRALPLGDVTDVSLDEGPAQISREQSHRRVLVESNVRGRDLASFVADLEGRLGKVELPPGYYLELAGQYENLTRATTRLAIVVPLTLVAIFLMLYFTFHRVFPAVLIFLNIPAAASGGVLALAARGMPLSISAAVGFIALFGVATLNGVVLLSSIEHAESKGMNPFRAALHAAHGRLRPVMTTAAVASLGFLPMAIATGTGAEVQRPLATVVMGGLVTATVMTLGALPSLYALFAKKGLPASD